MKTGVLLLNLGGPETLEEVRPFLFRLFRDPDIIPLPRWLRWLSWPIAWLIAKFRAPKSREAYAAIGGGSPLRRTNDALAAKLLPRLRAAGLADEIAVAMRYWHPLTDAALDRLRAAGVERIVCLPMYPHYSTTTTMSSYRELRRRLRRHGGWKPQVLTALDYHLDPRYLDAVRARMRPLLQRLPDEAGACAVLFSAHSIPMDRVRESGDPYPGQIEAMAAELARDLPAGVRHDIAYQSRVGPVEWVGPDVPDKLRELAGVGIRHLVVVPVSFVSEHVETLEEIDIEYAQLAAELGIATFLRAPTVQADDDFVDMLSGLTADVLANRHDTVCRRAGSGLPCVCQPSPA